MQSQGCWGLDSCTKILKPVTNLSSGRCMTTNKELPMTTHVFGDLRAKSNPNILRGKFSWTRRRFNTSDCAKRLTEDSFSAHSTALVVQGLRVQRTARPMPSSTNPPLLMESQVCILASFKVKCICTVVLMSLCVCVDLREDVPHVGVVGAAERWRSIAAILYTAFTLGFTATCNTHTHTL